MRIEPSSVRHYLMEHLRARYFVVLISCFLVTTCIAEVETEEPDRINALIEQLGDEKETVLVGAKDALVQFGQEAVSVLIEALQNDQRSTVRYYSGWALGEIGGEKAREALSEAAETDSVSDVRDSAILALARIKLVRLSGEHSGAVQKEAKKLIGIESFSELRGMLIKSGNRITRQRSAGILARIADKSTVRFFEKALRRTAEPVTRRHMCEALGLLGHTNVKVAVSASVNKCCFLSASWQMDSSS